MLTSRMITVLTVCIQILCVTGQTFSVCNPLHEENCPPDTALSKSINIDFTRGSVDSFTASGNPKYDADGVHFTVAKSGDAPQLNSLFYIMFGKVSVTLKTAPGIGIVSSLVLQSDTLDEIDMEWLGSRSADMQTNYFSKGDTTTYDRGAFNSVPNHQDRFITYSIEWTSTQIQWSVGDKVVRVLTPSMAGSNRYPQTPMQVKIGAWSAGDFANSPGTIAWAGGSTDYSKGPYTLTVKSIAVSDYSTGTQYKYSDQSGSWGSIRSVGGKVDDNARGTRDQIITSDIPSVTSLSPSIPAGFGKKRDPSSSRTQWPWVATSTSSVTTQAATPVNGLPSGWSINSLGKVVPANSAAIVPGISSSSSSFVSSNLEDGTISNPNFDSYHLNGIISGETMTDKNQNQEIQVEPITANVNLCQRAYCKRGTETQEIRVSLATKLTINSVLLPLAISCFSFIMVG